MKPKKRHIWNIIATIIAMEELWMGLHLAVLLICQQKEVKFGIHRKLQKERALGLFLSTGLNIKDMVSQGLSVSGFENQCSENDTTKSMNGL